jgi:hypothetical protein
MPTITVQVPDELKRRMDKHEIINWSAVARNAFEKQLSNLEFFKEFAKDSTMTEEDAIRFGREVSQKAGERYRKLYGKKR